MEPEDAFVAAARIIAAQLDRIADALEAPLARIADALESDAEALDDDCDGRPD